MFLVLLHAISAAGSVSHSKLVQQQCFGVQSSQVLTFRPNITTVSGSLGAATHADSVIEMYSDPAMTVLIASGMVRSSDNTAVTTFAGALIYEKRDAGWGYSECTSTVLNPTPTGLAKVVCKYSSITGAGSSTCTASYAYGQ